MSRIQTIVVSVLLAAPVLAGAQVVPRSGGTSAVRPPTAPQSANPFDGLVLTNTQKATLRRLTAESRAASAVIVQRQSPGTPLSAADRAAFREIAERHNAGVRAALAPVQRDRLDANVRALRERAAAAQEGRVGR